jgi:xylan 1,4-beta-xylosidase
LVIASRDRALTPFRARASVRPVAHSLFWRARHTALGAALLVTVVAGCAKDPARSMTTGSAGTGAIGGGGGSGPVTGVCSDSQEWTPPPGPRACGETPPAASGAAEVTIAVDAGASVGAWNRFYEKAVASDHANTLLCTAYHRNIQNAIRKAHAQAGFQYLRFHGLFNDDVGAYKEDASGAPIYDWSRIDAIYDAIMEAGMRPLVEISFTPLALASDRAEIQELLWYNSRSPNISPPTGANGDWGKWIALMAEFVRHLEDRYGAEEVRKNWYFEVWNEPSWMYSLNTTGYFELYRNTVAGLLQGDPEVRVGGPAGSSGESSALIRSLITGSFNTGTKLDFVTYHRYGDDDGIPIASVTQAVAFHKRLLSDIDLTVIKNMKFTGEILNDEFGPTWMPGVSRDNEIGASYVAKTIHLLGTDPTVPAPAAYGYWAVSDLYEEIPTGTATAFRQGNYGLLLKGDPGIPESWDVAKPTFNAFRLLHMMGAERLGVTGGTTGDGVGAAATRSTDGSAVQILVYNHVDGGGADVTKASVVSLAVNNLPFTGRIRVRRYIVDHGHANAYRAWLALGSPTNPTQQQWVMLRDAAELCYYETIAQPTGAAWTLTFPQSFYGVALFEITAAP